MSLQTILASTNYVAFSGPYVVGICPDNPDDRETVKTEVQRFQSAGHEVVELSDEEYRLIPKNRVFPKARKRSIKHG